MDKEVFESQILLRENLDLLIKIRAQGINSDISEACDKAILIGVSELIIRFEEVNG